MLSLRAALPCSLLAAGQSHIHFLVSTTSLSCAKERRSAAAYMGDAEKIKRHTSPRFCVQIPNASSSNDRHVETKC